MGFFNFNLENLLSGGDWSTTNIDGKSARLKQVLFTQNELEMFDELDIIEFSNGSIWLDFFSTEYSPTKPLMDLMAYCTALWGNDKHGKGNPTSEDIESLKKGTFRRIWENVQIIQIKRPKTNNLTIALRIIYNGDMVEFVSTLETLDSLPNYKIEKKNIYTDFKTTANQSPKRRQLLNSAFSTTECIICVIIALFLFPLGTIGVLIYVILKYLKRKNNKSNVTTNESVQSPIIKATPKCLFDFFKYDLKNIPIKSENYTHSKINRYGTEVKYYSIYLPEPEMGIFSQLDIYEVGDNDYNLTFSATKQLITDEIVEFVKFCTTNLGETIRQSGNFSIDCLNKCDFCRIWDKVLIDQDMNNANLQITLRGLKRDIQ